MKRTLLLSALVLGFIRMSAQLPDGSIAPDFTGIDTDGNSHHLYELLEAGNVVILNVFAAWDSYSWNYYQSGELNQLSMLDMPEGIAGVVILNIEAEALNSLAQLQGPAAITGNAATETEGDWLTSNPFPVIDDAAIADTLDVNFIPTLYIVCPDHHISQSSQLSAAELYSDIGLSCIPAVLPVDPSFHDVSADNTCGATATFVYLTLKNLGTLPLTSAYITITGGTLPFGYSWSGNLDTFEEEELEIGPVGISGYTQLTVTVTSEDGNASNSTTDIWAGAPGSTNQVQLELNLDSWPEEVSWEIRNEEGSVLYSGGDYATPYEYFQTDFYLPSTGCYSFYLFDTAGDGLHGSIYGGFDGLCYLRSMSGPDTTATLYSYDGSHSFSMVDDNGLYYETTAFNVVEVVGVEDQTSRREVLIYPNPSRGVLNIKGERSATYEIRDAAGALVNEGMLSAAGASTLDLTSLMDGFYILKISRKDSIIARPFVLSK